jgi:Ni2+-binding GTPase involved in maturation of urease and hydrogenase
MPQLDVMKFYNYIDAENANGLIYAPTQVGKTEAIISFIEACFHRDTPVIVSSDNKLDQLDQLYRRVQRRLAGIEAHMMCVSDRKFETTLKNIVYPCK